MELHEKFRHWQMLLHLFSALKKISQTHMTYKK
uniref:Uncharacterized protein n=1 Tax=Rhizophora mucronata TaxID=61149 RepID=A0A2P2PZ75_RHIMU